MKHNNALASNHFKKTSLRFKTWFHQPVQKRIRKERRVEKERRMYPMPLQKLRPIVRCPSRKYNGKQRLGRGFSLVELKEAGLVPEYARTIGITVDTRRYNKSEESIQENVERLKTYLSRITIYKSRKEAKEANPPQHRGALIPVVKKKPSIESIPVSEIRSDVSAIEEMKKLRFETIRRKEAKGLA